MKHVNFNKNMQEAYSAYERSKIYSLNNCYEKCSKEKLDAFNHCRSLKVSKEKESISYGELKIISYNVYQFTAGFVYTDLDHKKHFVRITKTQELDCVLPEGF